MKYNLTFWQRLQLPLIWMIWAGAPDDKRKTWHEVKKGMEHHICDWEEKPYSIDRDRYEITEWRRCKHEGCNTVTTKRIQTQAGIDLDNRLGFKRDERGFLIT